MLSKFVFRMCCVVFSVVSADGFCEEGATPASANRIRSDIRSETSNTESDIAFVQVELLTQTRHERQRGARVWTPKTAAVDAAYSVRISIPIQMIIAGVCIGTVILASVYCAIRYTGLNNALIVGSCAAAGDLLTQYSTMLGGTVDLRRNVSFCSFGALWSVPNVLLFQALAHRYPSDSFSGAVKGALIFEFAFNIPITTPVLIAFTDLLRGFSGDFIKFHVLTDWKECACVAAVILFPSTIANLWFVPPRYRVLVDALIDVIYIAGFSYFSNHVAEDTESAGFSYFRNSASEDTEFPVEVQHTFQPLPHDWTIPILAGLWCIIFAVGAIATYFPPKTDESAAST